jgi:hypothetical protein
VDCWGKALVLPQLSINPLIQESIPFPPQLKFLCGVCLSGCIKRTMKHGRILGIFAVMGLLTTDAKAVSNMTGPYDGIAERNVFHLQPAPLQHIIDPEPFRPQPPKITLTGITTILGRKVAFLTAPAAKPGALPESMMLAEGQAQDGVEVREIDEKAGVVKIINHDEPQTLDFEHDGAKATSPSPVLGPNLLRPVEHQPGVAPGPPPSRSNVSPEEQVALIEVQRVKYRLENNPLSGILPPTELTAEGDAPAP